MALPERPNARKFWTPEEADTLRRLADAGVPLSLIASQLGRSVKSVSKRAGRLGISLGQNSITRIAERRETRRRDKEEQAPG